MQAFSLQSSLSSPRLLHQSSAPSSGLATPQPLERDHSTGLQLQRCGEDSDQVCNHAAYTCALAATAIMKHWPFPSRHMRLNFNAETSAKLEACSL